MGKKQSLSTKERAQIVTLSNLKFSVRQIAKKIKVSKIAMHNAIIKYQNESVFIDGKSFYLHVYVPTSMSLGKVQTFLLHRLSQAWFSGWLAWFKATFQKQTALNCFCTDCCASFHQLSLNWFGGTHWKVRISLMHKAVFSAGGNPWSARPFPVYEYALILVFHDCIEHSCLANLCLLRDLTYRKN